ncbi:MAG: L,D-transpeptidase family protein, partial [Pseudomonadota bacterium]
PADIAARKTKVGPTGVGQHGVGLAKVGQSELRQADISPNRVGEAEVSVAAEVETDAQEARASVGSEATVPPANPQTADKAPAPDDDPEEVAGRATETKALAKRLAARVEKLAAGRKDARRRGDDRADRKALVEFYNSPDGRPIFLNRGWADSSAPRYNEDVAEPAALVGQSRRAASLMQALEAALDWGLDPADFDVKQLSSLHGEDAEVALALAALKYARHARGSRISAPAKDLSSFLDRGPQLIAASTVVNGLAETTDVADYLQSLHPKHASFQNLRRALLRLRKSELETEKVVKLPVTGPLLRQGRRHPDVALLRQRLNVSTPKVVDGARAEDVQGVAIDQTAAEDQEALDDKQAKPQANDPELFDAQVAKAVKAFQRDNSLSADGIVGRQTRAVLNGGKREITEDMLIANMEMWRWMPDDLGARHVMVNIPEYAFRVIDDEQEIHRERVIVGKLNKQTPVFSDVLEYLVFNPKWGVPNSIKVNELLPSLARGGRYFHSQKLRLTYRGRAVDPSNVDWSRADIRQYHVYQPPGPHNVLGVVKFRFPNHHQVYMHDTNSKSLFKRSKRTLSHGCVRVRDPMRLAELLLQADRGWSSSRVGSLVGGSRENNVTLKTPVPVHMTYQTAMADADGNVTTFPDVYGHEKRIRLALAKQWSKISRHRNHLAPVRIDRRKIDRLVSANGSNPVNNLFQAIFGF